MVGFWDVGILTEMPAIIWVVHLEQKSDLWIQNSSPGYFRNTTVRFSQVFSKPSLEKSSLLRWKISLCDTSVMIVSVLEEDEEL